MANKREFKKYITAVSASICQDMMDAYYTFDGIDKDAIDNAVIEILQAGEFAIMKSNVKFDKGEKAFPLGGYRNARRAFFKTLYKKTNKEFADAVDKAIKKFNAAIPESVKAENKANA